jgi:hypothetical protein
MFIADPAGFIKAFEGTERRAVLKHRAKIRRRQRAHATKRHRFDAVIDRSIDRHWDRMVEYLTHNPDHR